MESSLDLEIRKRLSLYLAGEISLQNFEEWFVPASWNVHQSGNQAAINLVYDIELWLAEFSDGIWSEQELKQYLLSLSENYHVDMVKPEWVASASNAKINRWKFQFSSFDIQYAEGRV